MLSKKYLDIREIFLLISSNVFLLLGIGFAIIIGGLIFEFMGYNTALERCGSLLVCYALFCFYLNHHTNKLADGLKELSSTQTDVWEDEENLRTVLSKYSFDEEKIEILVKNLPSSVRQLQGEYKPLIKKKKNLTTAEIMLGIMGTFIWGFVDLLADGMLKLIT